MENLPLSKKLWHFLGLESFDSCANTESLFLEYKGKFYKLTPVEVTTEEYNSAWDSNNSDSCDAPLRKAAGDL